MTDNKKTFSLNISWSRYLGPWTVVGFVLSTSLFVAGLYFYNFAFSRGASLSTSTSVWGEFGDYVGGVMNPVVALAALWLLAYSVSIQRIEMRDTRKALEDQAAHSEDMVRLNAMVAVIDYLERHLQVLRNEEQSLPRSNTVAAAENPSIANRRAEISAEIERTINRRDALVVKVERMLVLSPLQEIHRMAKGRSY